MHLFCLWKLPMMICLKKKQKQNHNKKTQANHWGVGVEWVRCGTKNPQKKPSQNPDEYKRAACKSLED